MELNETMYWLCSAYVGFWSYIEKHESLEQRVSGERMSAACLSLIPLLSWWSRQQIWRWWATQWTARRRGCRTSEICPILPRWVYVGVLWTGRRWEGVRHGDDVQYIILYFYPPITQCKALHFEYPLYQDIRSKFFRPNTIDIPSIQSQIWIWPPKLTASLRYLQFDSLYSTLTNLIRYIFGVCIFITIVNS